LQTYHSNMARRRVLSLQRNGRILRQGNLSKEVKIFHYLTEDTFDAYLMQIITNKQKFIGQLMSGDNSVRSCEDLDGRAMNYAEMQALCSGDPKIKEKIQGEIRLQELRSLESGFNKRKYQYQATISSVPLQIEGAEKNLARAKIDAEKRPPEEFSMIIKGKVYTEHKEANEAIYAEILRNKFNNGTQEIIGEYGGYEIALQNSYGNTMKLVLKGELDYYTDAGELSTSQNWQRLHNLAENCAIIRTKGLQNNINELQENLRIAENKVGSEFEFADELKTLRTTLAELDQYFATKDDVMADEVDLEVMAVNDAVKIFMQDDEDLGKKR